MSAIHTGSITVRIKNGQPEFTGTNENHAVAGWPDAAQDVRVRIPAQRVVSAYEAVVLKTEGDLL